LIKYGILTILGIGLLYQIIPIGDYCSGLLGFLNLIVFGGLLIFTFIIISIIDLIRVFRKKQKFDFIPLILTLIFCISYYLVLELENKKFWTKSTLIGFVIKEGTPRSGTLKLYKNKSFGATLHSADFSCTFQGEYEITEDTLYLKRNGISELTEQMFTTKYIINKKDSVLFPLERDFLKIEIRKISE